MTLKVDHPNAKTAWTTIDFQDGKMKTILVVETDLALNVGDPDYDGNAVDQLIGAVDLAVAEQGFGMDVLRLIEIKP